MKIRLRMVDEQIISRGITDDKVIKAMKEIPRDLFVQEKDKEFAYEDYPLPIGYGQTISQPYIVALMTEALELSGEDRVLEIGTGSGYQTAILASIAKEVYTLERIPELLENAEVVLRNLGFKNIKFFCRNGWEGLEEFAPFDKIIVTAAPIVIPEALKKQLKVKGIMVIPVGPLYNQLLLKITRKSEKHFEETTLEAVRFVTMVKD
ncbi:MAG: protein-L-isoaspartate(D-aspartate) O-methyltransferase [Brevinematia bacterium]